MIPVLEDYLNINNEFPDGVSLGKKRRKQRHQALMEWRNRQYEAAASVEELAAFWRAYPALPFGKPFCTKVVVPCVLQDLEAGGIEGLRFLFASNEKKADWDVGTTDDFVEIFCAETGWSYQPFQLADKILQQDPQNKAVLRQFALICRQLQLDEEQLIQSAKTLYRAYEAYLKTAEKYSDFADYLDRHEIPY